MTLRRVTIALSRQLTSNIAITPHIASTSVATRTKLAMMAVDNLLAGVKGERPAHIVNTGVLVKYLPLD